MEILGVGVPELMFIVLIALILLGPKDMIAAGRAFGKILRQFLTSPTWLAMRRTGEELQQLPTKLIREAGLDELQKDVQNITDQIKPLDLKTTFDEANKKLYIPEVPAKSVPVSTPDPLPPPTSPDQPSEPPSTTETKNNN